MPYHILVHGKTCITVIFDLSILIYGAGVVQNMAILGVKTGLLWQACWGVRTQPGNLLMRHITSHYMAEHVFGNMPDVILVNFWSFPFLYFQNPTSGSKVGIFSNFIQKIIITRLWPAFEQASSPLLTLTGEIQSYTGSLAANLLLSFSYSKSEN